MLLDRRKLERAVVLAAGTGSRLVNGEAQPKPLKPVAGVPLLVRILRVLQAEGIREAVIVVGHQGDLIRRALVAEPSLTLSFTFVENEHFTLKNGVSLLAARAHVTEGTLLTMADHLYAPEIVRRLRAMDLPRGASALAIDHDIERCFDLDDATKVRVEHGRIVDIGKEIAAYDALDTGVFRIGPELLDELACLFAKHGDCSLSDGVRALSARGMFHVCDAGDARWIDVDTPAALEQAEALLELFGDRLGGQPSAPAAIQPEPSEVFTPSWARVAQPAL
ncbi:MAG TPA: NTP transferase domain-containing protein [Candidatus Nanopelagicales bacterium]|nr:NTP transferase domain-containing protein [Candidatus Nanopelagicales bacterium]